MHWNDRLRRTEEIFLTFTKGTSECLLRQRDPQGEKVVRCALDGSSTRVVWQCAERLVVLSYFEPLDLLVCAADRTGREELEVFTVSLRESGRTQNLMPDKGIILSVGPVVRWPNNTAALTLEIFHAGQFAVYAAPLKSGGAWQVCARSDRRLEVLAQSPTGELLLRNGGDELNAELLRLRASPNGTASALLSGARVVSATYLDESSIIVHTDMGKEHLGVWRVSADRGHRQQIVGGCSDIDHSAMSPDGRLFAIGKFAHLKHDLHIVDAQNASYVTVPLPTGVIAGRLVWAADGRWLALTVDQAFRGKYAVVFDVARQCWVKPPEESSSVAATACREITVSDGTPVEVGLLLPTDRPGPWPVMISAHGGPAARFDFSFCPEIECFVDFGYAVVAPNFRGSTGYGRSFIAADDGRKRLAALSDWMTVVQRVQHFVDVDPVRIVHMGASYGSFLVLNSAIDCPPAAAISLFGIVDFTSFLESTAEWRYAEREREYGSLATERGFFADISPLSRAAQIGCPLFLSHGTADIRVSIEQSRALSRVRGGARTPTEFHEVPGEGHGYRSISARCDCIARMASFVARYAGVS